ncbi:MAG: hypothetical protein ACO1SV_01270 [Fimbriimonas sp.]
MRKAFTLKSMSIAALAMVAGTATAQNGHWTLEDYIFNGSTSDIAGPGYIWDWAHYINDAFTISYRGIAAGTVGHSGSVKAKYKWNPGSGPNNLPPTRLYALVMPRARAYVSMMGAFPGSYSLNVDNGYEQMSNPLASSSLYITRTGYSQANVSGVEALIPSPSMSVLASKTGVFGELWTSLSIGFAHLPPFKVIAPNHENTNYQCQGGAAAPNLRDRDHEITLDVAATWNDSLNLWMGGHATDHLNAGFGHFSSPEYSWNQFGDGTPSNLMAYDFTLNSATVLLQMYFAKAKNVNALNQTSAFHVFVSDADDPTSPVLNNRLTIRWHAPFENWRQNGATREVLQPQALTVANPGYAMENGNIGCTWTYYHPYWAAINQSSIQLLNVASNMLNPPYAGLAGLLGVVAADMAPKPDTGAANFNDCWTDPLSSWPQGKTLAKSQYRMQPELLVGYDVKPMEADGYGGHGYTGLVKQPVALYNGKKKWVGVFTPWNQPGGDDSGGGPGGSGTPGQPGGTPYGL